MDALRLRPDAVRRAGRGAENGVGGVRQPAAIVGMALQARARTRNDRAALFAVRLGSDPQPQAQLATAGSVPRSERGLGRADLIPDLVRAAKERLCPSVSRTRGEQTSSQPPVSDQGPILQRFKAGNAGQSLKPPPVVRRVEQAEHGAGVRWRRTRSVQPLDDLGDIVDTRSATRLGDLRSALGGEMTITADTVKAALAQAEPKAEYALTGLALLAERANGELDA